MVIHKIKMEGHSHGKIKYVTIQNDSHIVVIGYTDEEKERMDEKQIELLVEEQIQALTTKARVEAD